MITLYGHSRVPYTEKVRRAILYKGLAFELREPSSVEDYRRWSPKTGLLPVLDLDGESIPDSTDILFALDARYPEPPLLSPDPTVSTQQRQLEEWADASFLWYFMKYRRMIGEGAPLPTTADPRGEARADAADGPEAAGNGGTPTRTGRTLRALRHLGAWLRAGGTWERPLTGLHRELGLRLDDLVNFLGARPFFYAERLSMADLAVYSMLFTMRNDSIPGASRLVALRPSLVAFMARVEDATERVAVRP